MRKRCQNAPIKWLLGVVLVSLGTGMLLCALLPYCIPLVAILCIAAGIWLLYHFKRC